MSNSRRGFLAAGLAAAVVGSTGVVWTLNASAEETPAAEAPAAVVAEAPAAVVAPEAGEPVLVPPKLLPWGAKPKKIKRAKPGASSAAVAAVGAGAAPADTSGATEATPEFAPKGGSNGPGGTPVKSQRTDIVPPTPPTVGTIKPVAAAAADRPVYFNYLTAIQVGETDGTWANLTIEKPTLADGDYHTLAEIAVQSADTRQTVEVGWTVDRSVNGDDDPHLFVFHWKDGKRTCYNCGFSQLSKTVKPGDTLPVGAQKRFGIQHTNNGWWIAYDSEWIGAFPDTNWGNKFTRGGVIQWFGEVASSDLFPCTQMGNSKASLNGNAARIGSISMTSGPEVKFGLDPRPKFKRDAEGRPLLELLEDKADPTDPKNPWWSPWNGELLSSTTFRYGGPQYPSATPPDPEKPDEKPADPIVQC